MPLARLEYRVAMEREGEQGVRRVRAEIHSSEIWGNSVARCWIIITHPEE